MDLMEFLQEDIHIHTTNYAYYLFLGFTVCFLFGVIIMAYYAGALYGHNLDCNYEEVCTNAYTLIESKKPAYEARYIILNASGEAADGAL